MQKIKALTPFERHSLLLAESEKRDLPKFFKEDLVIDRKILEKYKNSSVLWVLRESGTVMIPLRKGVDPTHISYWVKDEVALFYVITLRGMKQITAEQAVKMANEPPCDLSIQSTVAGLVLAVRRIIRQGQEYGLWDFNKDESWGVMSNFFHNSSNTVMAQFMDDALRRKMAFDKARKSQYHLAS